MTTAQHSPPRILDFITLGESMIRLSPPGASRLETTTQLNAFIGGAEGNAAVAMARLGKRSAWLSRLPDHPLAHLIVNALRGYGVDVSGVRWVSGERLGTYYVEAGSAPRATKVWYDRANSAASRMTPADLPLDLIASARWLHLTGITPALSASCAETVRAAIDHAHANRLTVSFDVNYRALLWTPEAARAALEPLCKVADVVFLAARDGRNLFGTDDVRILHERWGGTIAMTHGAERATGCTADGDTASADAFSVAIVDRLGAGDAFACGVMCLLMEGAPFAEALRFGCAVAALKLTIPGDFALVSRAEVDDLIRQQGSSSIHR